ncbi:hypothetical protein F5Y14DRAFT_427102 [Nemania sp. NC0429]|nr:hypothetical protein F5Y14DRAFT_427102 [Nemania sp. NC0429]
MHRHGGLWSFSLCFFFFFFFFFLNGSDQADTIAVRTCSGIRHVPVDRNKRRYVEDDEMRMKRSFGIDAPRLVGSIE